MTDQGSTEYPLTSGRASTFRQQIAVGASLLFTAGAGVAYYYDSLLEARWFSEWSIPWITAALIAVAVGGIALLLWMMRGPHLAKIIAPLAFLLGLLTYSLLAPLQKWEVQAGPWQFGEGSEGCLLQQGRWILGWFHGSPPSDGSPEIEANASFSSEFSFCGYRRSGRLWIAEGGIYRKDGTLENRWDGIQFYQMFGGELEYAEGTVMKPVRAKITEADEKLTGVWLIEPSSTSQMLSLAGRSELPHEIEEGISLYQSVKDSGDLTATYHRIHELARILLPGSTAAFADHRFTSDNEIAAFTDKAVNVLSKWSSAPTVYVALMPKGDGQYVGRFFALLGGNAWPMERLDLRQNGDRLSVAYADDRFEKIHYFDNVNLTTSGELTLSAGADPISLMKLTNEKFDTLASEGYQDWACISNFEAWQEWKAMAFIIAGLIMSFFSTLFFGYGILMFVISAPLPDFNSPFARFNQAKIFLLWHDAY